MKRPQGIPAIDAVLSVAFVLLAVPGLYGLHRLGLYLESRDLIYYWHKKPSGGSAYNPLQELVQPQIRHVIEVGEQRQGEGGDGLEGDGEGDFETALGGREDGGGHG
jgi:hypothetical protein